jgi:hypothetical protein
MGSKAGANRENPESREKGDDDDHLRHPGSRKQ